MVLGRLNTDLGSSMGIGHSLPTVVWAGFGLGGPGALVGDVLPGQGHTSGATATGLAPPEPVVPKLAGTSEDGEGNKATDKV